jgi:outer membrane protein assembly factor BamD (BamD/ComL family)
MHAVADTAIAPAVTATAAPAPTTAPTAPATVAPTQTASAPTLAEELALVDSARTMLASGDYAGAIRFVNKYESRFPRGAFTHEAEVVRIDAVVRSGQRAAAIAAAKRFVAAYPTSPHAPRMRALIGDGP